MRSRRALPETSGRSGRSSISVFRGWFVSGKASRDELALADPRLHAIWYFLIRYIVPPAVLLIFVMGVATS